MHRVFENPPELSPPHAVLDHLRAALRDRGLAELPVASGHIYVRGTPGRRPRMAASVHGRPWTASIYLYAGAFDVDPSAIAAFYQAMEEDGLSVGSVAGVSVSIDYAVPAQVERFAARFAALLGCPDTSPP